MDIPNNGYYGTNYKCPVSRGLYISYLTKYAHELSVCLHISRYSSPIHMMTKKEVSLTFPGSFTFVSTRGVHLRVTYTLSATNTSRSLSSWLLSHWQPTLYVDIVEQNINQWNLRDEHIQPMKTLRSQRCRISTVITRGLLLLETKHTSVNERVGVGTIPVRELQGCRLAVGLPSSKYSIQCMIFSILYNAWLCIGTTSQRDIMGHSAQTQNDTQVHPKTWTSARV